jgi:hypothetical protein
MLKFYNRNILSCVKSLDELILHIISMMISAHVPFSSFL